MWTSIAVVVALLYPVYRSYDLLKYNKECLRWSMVLIAFVYLVIGEMVGAAGCWTPFYCAFNIAFFIVQFLLLYFMNIYFNNP